MTPGDDDADRRLRIEEDDLPDPEKPDPLPTLGIGGRVDEMAERAAREYTWDSRGAPPDEGLGVSHHVDRAPESGRGETVVLDADAERTVSVGDELWVHVPVAGRHGWTYDVEGDEAVVDVEERAELLQGTRHLPPPDGTEFVVRTEKAGRAAVRFEPVDGDARLPPRRLRLTVR
ncbi:MAG TPA: hypothetical protein VN193_16730 [Candidatus Angelobacter sp.]|jgi:hypothetical protein|nr:hypothetical protein [Candidatus Angelobacter sp.]